MKKEIIQERVNNYKNIMSPIEEKIRELYHDDDFPSTEKSMLLLAQWLVKELRPQKRLWTREITEYINGAMEERDRIIDDYQYQIERLGIKT